MRPRIEDTSFGSITVDGQKLRHDIVLRLNGSVEKRKKKLSKRVYGTSHSISLDEAQHVYVPGAELLIVGTGKFDSVRLSEEAQEFFKRQQCQVRLANTAEAMHIWNSMTGNVIGLFHVTC